MKKNVIIFLAILLTWSVGLAASTPPQEQIQTIQSSISLLEQNVSTLQENSDSLNSRITRLKNEVESLRSDIDSRVPDIVLLILIALALVLVLGLGVFLFFSKKISKKQAEATTKKLEGLEEDKSRMQSEIEALTSKTAELSAALEKLRDEISQKQQKQQSSEEPKSQPAPAQPQPQSLYADTIINGTFNKVKEQPDDDTIFELKLSKAGDAQAKVIVYEPAYPRIIARPAFLDGCKKQILGKTPTTVTMLCEGIATNNNGKWNLKNIPEVEIS